MDYIELKIIALATSQSSPGNYVIVLQELPYGRKLPIIIGGFEAQAIAIAIEKIKPSRPLTHDLYKHTLEVFETELRYVSIHKFEHGIFYATLFCEKSNGDRIELDSRASDAISLALRFGCPIYTVSSVLDKAGLYTEENTDFNESETDSLEDFSTEELEKMMEELLEKEEYEQAAKLRDVMDKKAGDEN